MVTGDEIIRSVRTESCVTQAQEQRKISAPTTKPQGLTGEAEDL